MKYIQSFNEARSKNKNVLNIVNKADKLAEVKDKWQKFEDDQAWDFDYFWSKIEAYFNDYNNPNNRGVLYEICLKNYSSDVTYNRSDGSGGYVPVKDDDIWQRRTGYIEAYINTSGYSGGSCWDDADNYARYYETYYTLEVDDLLGCIKYILISVIGTNPIFTSLDELMDKLSKSNLIQDDDWTDYEYYGNSDNYRSYFITLWDLYVFLSKEQVL